MNLVKMVGMKNMFVMMVFMDDLLLLMMLVDDLLSTMLVGFKVLDGVRRFLDVGMTVIFLDDRGSM